MHCCVAGSISEWLYWHKSTSREQHKAATLWKNRHIRRQKRLNGKLKKNSGCRVGSGWSSGACVCVYYILEDSLLPQCVTGLNAFLWMDTWPLPSMHLSESDLPLLSRPSLWSSSVVNKTASFTVWIVWDDFSTVTLNVWHLLYCTHTERQLLYCDDRVRQFLYGYW